MKQVFRAYKLMLLTVCIKAGSFSFGSFDFKFLADSSKKERRAEWKFRNKSLFESSCYNFIQPFCILNVAFFVVLEIYSLIKSSGSWFRLLYFCSGFKPIFFQWKAQCEKNCRICFYYCGDFCFEFLIWYKWNFTIPFISDTVCVIISKIS